MDTRAMNHRVPALARTLVLLALPGCFVDEGPMSASAGEGTSSAGETSTTGGLTSTSAGPTTDDTSSSSSSSTSSTTDATTTTTTTTDATTTASTEPTTTTMTTSSTTDAATCGDGVLDRGEECDLGADNADDGACKSDCTFNVCGDGHVGPGEGCDDGNLEEGDGCSATCVSESCGDGMIQGGEECDDGNSVDDDACTNACTLPACGDGVLQPDIGELCDDGGDNGPNAPCTPVCQKNVCGDKLVLANVEECDDGNLVATDSCTNTCMNAKCGDGLVYAGFEECDDGNAIDNDTCTNTCLVNGKRVFVTNGTYTGNLGGVAGADTKCQSVALAEGLGGTWKAWIATSKIDESPTATFIKSTGPYVRLDGLVVATSWNDLTDGSLMNPINITEKVAPAGQSVTVWTNVSSSGGPSGAGTHCSGWATNSQAAEGRFGDRTQVDPDWTYASLGGCSSLRHLYCFEQ